MAAPPYGPGGPGYPAMPPIMTGPRPTVSNPLAGGAGAPGWANPLMYAGLGLLSQGPSLTPQSPLQGLVPGLQMGMQANALAAEQARQNEMLELRREEAAAKRDERERAIEKEATEARQAAAQRSAIARSLVARGIAKTPEEAELLASSGQGGKMLSAADPMAKFRAYQEMSPEDRAAYASYAEAMRPPGISIINPPAGYGPDPENPGQLRAIPGGPADPSRRTAKEVAEEKAAAEASARLSTLIDEYEDMASSFGLWGADASAAQAKRRAIAKAKARALEPTGKLTDSDIELQMADVPDIGGPYDAAVASRLLDELRINSGLPPRSERKPLKRVTDKVGVAPAYPPEATAQRPDFVYNPSTGGLE